MFTLKWVVFNPSIGPRYHGGYIGKWRVFTINMSMSRREGNYVLFCDLPGISKITSYETTDDAKAAASKILAYWTEKAITPPQEEGGEDER